MTPVRPIPTSGAMRPHSRRSSEGRPSVTFRAMARDQVNATDTLEPLPASRALALIGDALPATMATNAPDSSFALLTRSLEQARGARWPSGWLLDIIV